MLSFASSKMKKTVVLPSRSRFPVKLDNQLCNHLLDQL